MSEQPLVSIIVPIYNAQDHIARCVESIRRQTYRNLEILLLNDGSQDVSLEVCKMYANVDPRIVLIDKANSGVAATRNMGLREARGKYLQFVDADDTIQPYATELLVQRAEESGAELVIAHYNRITPPRPRAEDDPRPERPTKVQTNGVQMEGPKTTPPCRGRPPPRAAHQGADLRLPDGGPDDEGGIRRGPDAGTGQLLLRCDVE